MDVDYCTNESWYVVRCKTRKESYAAISLKSNLNVPVFLPEIMTSTRGERRRSSFFPGYLFIQANLHEVAPSRINTTPGVLNLVEFGGAPPPVPQTVIQLIAEEVDKINSICQPARSKFRRGDPVQVRNGPLQNLEMIFVGPTTPNERVRVLLYFLGRLKEVKVDANELVQVSGNLSPQQEELRKIVLRS